MSDVDPDPIRARFQHRRAEARRMLERATALPKRERTDDDHEDVTLRDVIVSRLLERRRTGE